MISHACTVVATMHEAPCRRLSHATTLACRFQPVRSRTNEHEAPYRRLSHAAKSTIDLELKSADALSDIVALHEAPCSAPLAGNDVSPAIFELARPLQCSGASPGTRRRARRLSLTARIRRTQANTLCSRSHAHFHIQASTRGAAIGASRRLYRPL